MDVIQAGVLGQLAGHSVAWFLSGKGLSDITQGPELTMAGLSIAAELSMYYIGTNGGKSLYPNAVQLGAIYMNRGVPSDPLRDPQVMGSAGSVAAKTYLLYSK